MNTKIKIPKPIKRLEVCLIPKEDTETMKKLNSGVIAIYNKNKNKSGLNLSNLFKLFIKDKIGARFEKEFQDYLLSFGVNDPRLNELETRTTQKEIIAQQQEEIERLKKQLGKQ